MPHIELILKNIKKNTVIEKAFKEIIYKIDGETHEAALHHCSLFCHRLPLPREHVGCCIVILSWMWAAMLSEVISSLDYLSAVFILV